MDQRIIDLYDEYTHAPLERRVFIKRLTALAGSTAAAMAVLPLLESNYAFAATVPPASSPGHGGAPGASRRATSLIRAFPAPSAPISPG